MLFQLWPAGWQQTLVSKGLNCLSSYLNDGEEGAEEHKGVTIWQFEINTSDILLSDGGCQWQ